jgi:hypothetical protein
MQEEQWKLKKEAKINAFERWKLATKVAEPTMILVWEVNEKAQNDPSSATINSRFSQLKIKYDLWAHLHIRSRKRYPQYSTFWRSSCSQSMSQFYLSKYIQPAPSLH